MTVELQGGLCVRRMDDGTVRIGFDNGNGTATCWDMAPPMWRHLCDLMATGGVQAVPILRPTPRLAPAPPAGSPHIIAPQGIPSGERVGSPGMVTP